ncbi:hypothetical protein PENSPDRAFT_646589 [Peniophora sp. CONT]|nr:hypothetical protein PENSPDRAFT_646589 [Peniophora sp. CONT]
MSARAGAEPHMLDVYKSDKTSQSEYDRLTTALRHQPQDVADAFRGLHRERTSLHGQDSQDDFIRMASTLADLFMFIPLNDGGTWRAIIGSDLFEVYVSIVSHDEFFFERQNMIDSVFHGLGHLLMASQRARIVQLSVLWARGAEHLWKRIWDNRRLLRIPQTNESPCTEVEAVEQGISIIELYWPYGKLVTTLALDVEALSRSYIPHMGLYLFVRCNPVFPGLHRLLEPVIQLARSSSGANQASAALQLVFQEAVIEDVGSIALLERINWCMTRKDRSLIDTIVPRNITELANCTSVLMLLSMITSLAPLMERYGCLHSAMLAIRVHRYSMPMQVYDNVAILLRSLSDAHWLDGDVEKTATICGEDVVTFLACGLELYTTDYFVGVDLSQLIDQYTAQAKTIQHGPKPIPPLSKTLFEGLRAGANAEWWPTLRYLQKAVPSARNMKLRIQVATEKWVAFGTALGLDATNERQRHERELRKRCSWRECQYHKESLPEVNIKACAGCGETRYCGRICQKR